MLDVFEIVSRLLNCIIAIILIYTCIESWAYLGLFELCKEKLDVDKLPEAERVKNYNYGPHLKLPTAVRVMQRHLYW